MAMKFERKSNIELLRIISMIFIIWHHYTLHGGILYVNYSNPNKYIAEAIYLLGKVGVNEFILISGYFLIKSKFKIKKLVKIELQILCYTLLFLILYIVMDKHINKKMIQQTFFPIIFNAYWFMTAYIGMYILSTFINKLIINLNKNEFKLLLIILLIMLSILPSITGINNFMGNLQWFIYIYMIGAYIQIYDITILKNRYLKYAIILLYSIIFFIGIIITLFSIENIQRFEKIKILAGMNFITTTILSILIFLFFKNLKLKNNKIINLFGKSSIAVYLWHDNEYIRYTLWKKIFNVERFFYCNFIQIISSFLFIFTF